MGIAVDAANNRIHWVTCIPIFPGRQRRNRSALLCLSAQTVEPHAIFSYDYFLAKGFQLFMNFARSIKIAGMLESLSALQP
jgi:hypothetical protein